MEYGQTDVYLDLVLDINNTSINIRRVFKTFLEDKLFKQPNKMTLFVNNWYAKLKISHLAIVVLPHKLLPTTSLFIWCLRNNK